MELSAREKYIAELKEFYKTKGDPALASLRKKYPNGFFPHDTMSMNIITQIYLNIKLWVFVGGAYYRYTDGGALLSMRSTYWFLCLGFRFYLISVKRIKF